MNIIHIIEINKELDADNKLTYDQLVNIICICYDHDLNFNMHVSDFYIEMMNIDDDSANDLIYDICHGDETSFERFAEDINYYCNE